MTPSDAMQRNCLRRTDQRMSSTSDLAMEWLSKDDNPAGLNLEGNQERDRLAMSGETQQAAISSWHSKNRARITIAT
jgi:hypothetical protein